MKWMCLNSTASGLKNCMGCQHTRYIRFLTEGITETNQEQTMPSWSAFHFLVTDKYVAQKIIKVCLFCHTQYSDRICYSVHSLKEFSICSESVGTISLACDEGVYHCNHEIIMNNPTEFSNLELYLGSFHLIKIVMGVTGKYIDGSGTETISAESKIPKMWSNQCLMEHTKLGH